MLDSSDTSIGNGTTAGSNTIAFNKTDGVQVEALYPGSAVGNHIFANAIFSNGGLGIDLRNDGNTANDLGDVDNGPNNSQNKPLIDSAKNASGKTTLKGRLNSASNRTYLVQLYSNPAGGNEGKKCLGRKFVDTNGSGSAAYAFVPANKVAAGRTKTATATDMLTGDTSEFSAPRSVVAS